MAKVKIGDTIKIIKMDGEPHYKDREGVVTHITLHLSIESEIFLLKKRRCIQGYGPLRFSLFIRLLSTLQIPLFLLPHNYLFI